MKQARYPQVIAFFGLLLVVAILHSEDITHGCCRNFTMFSCARDGLLESPKYQFVDELEFIDKDQSVKRVLIFSTQFSSKDAKNLERVVITDANYKVCARIEISGTTRIQNTTVLHMPNLPILEIVRYQPGNTDSVISFHYTIQNGELIPTDLLDSQV